LKLLFVLSLRISEENALPVHGKAAPMCISSKTPLFPAQSESPTSFYCVILLSDFNLKTNFKIYWAGSQLNYRYLLIDSCDYTCIAATLG